MRLISALDATMNSVSTLFVRDFVLRFRPRTSERTQVVIGRWAIAGCTAAGVAAAYLVYKTPEGLYKYLQTISTYLVMPITPAIVFGILSKRVNMKGAIASVAVGIVLATIFVTDQLMGVEAGEKAFPFLHHDLTLNYTYRGLWGTILVVTTLFGVSYLTPPPRPEQLATTTVNWGEKWEPFQGITDWRLHLAVLAVVTVVLLLVALVNLRRPSIEKDYTMDAVERVTKVLRGELPDRVPVALHNFLMACRMHGGRFDEILRDGEVDGRGAIETLADGRA